MASEKLSGRTQPLQHSTSVSQAPRQNETGQNCNSHVMAGGDPIGVSAGATMGRTSFLEVYSGFTKCIILSVQEAPATDAGPAHSDVTAAKDGND